MLKPRPKYTSSMGKVLKIGMMVLNMMVIGEMEWQKVKVSFIMLMEIFIQVNFSKIELMDTVNMFIKMGRNIKDFGKTICKMDQVRKN